MTSSSSSLLRFILGGFNVPHLLSARCQAHRSSASMAAREGSFSATGSTRARSSGSLARPSMLLLLMLPPVHMPFDWTCAPRQRHSCLHRGLVVLDPFGKRLQCGQVARFYRTQPGVHLLSCLLPDHLHERLCQAVGALGMGTGLSDQRQRPSLPLF